MTVTNTIGTSHLLERLHDGGACSEDHIGGERSQFCCVFAKQARIARTPAILDPQVTPIRPT